MKSYGKELIIDLYGCNVSNFTREILTRFFNEFCVLIKMEAEDLHFWDYEGDLAAKSVAPAHLDGTSAVQFIKTSDIVIHTLDKVGEAYINIFSCKDFNTVDATRLTEEWFHADTNRTDTHTIHRGIDSQCKMV